MQSHSKINLELKWVSQFSSEHTKIKQELKLDTDKFPRSESFGILSDPSASTKPTPGQIYYREDSLGSGSYGSVDKIVSLDKKHEAALKTQTVDNDSTMKEIKEEAELIKYAIGDAYLYAEGNLCFDNVYTMMKLLSSDLYQQYFKKNTASFHSVDECIELFINIAKAVAYFNEVLMLVHCDIKLSNIARDPVSGQIYLIDFGLTRYISHDTAGLWSKKCWHLPPETEKSIPAHTSIDIYSLGKILYHFNSQRDITGQILPLFSGIYSEMISDKPSDRPKIDEVIKFSVDLYNKRNPGKKLSYQWNELIPKPEIINLLKANQYSAMVLINNWLKEEKIASSPRKGALEALKKKIETASTVDDINKAMEDFTALDETIKEMRQKGQKGNFAQAYADYTSNPDKASAIKSKLQPPLASTVSISKP